MTTPPIDPSAAAEFILRRLYKPLNFGQTRRLAVAETEQALDGDTWFWTDDNAKVLEFLSRPELGRRYQQAADEVFEFLRLMCRGPFIFRRVSTPRLNLASQQGSEARFDHSVMHVRCDLPAGAVLAGIRFHDGRTAENLLLWTNRVEFAYRGRQYSLPVERAIDRVDTELRGQRLELRYSADLSFKPRRQDLRIGRIAYLYTIDAGTMVIGVEATLEVDPGADIADVVLTVGHDHLSHDTNHVHYSRVLAAVPGREPVTFTAGEPGRHILPVAGAEYYSFVQSTASRLAGFALAAHSAPREPGLLAEIEVEVREAGRLHLARTRYRFAGACRGRRLVAAEDKMLTAGGFYDRIAAYNGLLKHAVATRSAPQPLIDFSASYDYGAELHAFAQYFAAICHDNARQDLAAAARALFDSYLATYYDLFVADHYRNENTIYVRQLAFVILGLVTMYRSTGVSDYRQRLVELCDVLLKFERRFEDIAGNPASGFVLGVHRDTHIVYVDCHSAALLALTVAARYVADPRLAAAIDRGLGCYAIETARVEFGDRAVKVDLLAAHWADANGIRQSSNAYWNFHAGLTLRFFAALRNCAEPAVQAVAARHRDRLELLEMILRRQIERSLTWQDGAVEIRTSMLSSETNSETQPWVALALLDRPDA